MARMRYAWVPGYKGKSPDQVRGLDAQTAGEYLEQLYDEFQGHLTKDEILAAARKRNSPLNKFFEWDENRAAERYRHKQVGALLSSLRIKRDKKATTTRAFVFVSNPDHKGRKVYIDIQSAMRNPEMKREVIAKSMLGLRRWVTAFGGASELENIVPTVEKLLRQIEAETLANAGV